MAANNSNVIVRLRLLGRQAFAAEARSSANSLSTLQRAGNSLNSTFRSLGTGLNVFGLAAGAASVQIARMGAQTNQTQDRQLISFTALLKSKSKALKMMKDIQQLSLDSPVLDPVSTGDGVRTLLAYGISAKKVLPTIKALGDMSVVSGKSIQEVLPLASMALGQIAGKGRLQMQEVNQLVQSVGIGVGDIAHQMGMSTKQFQNSFKPGKLISADKALPAIMRAMQARSKGASEALSKTTEGRKQAGIELAKAAAGDLTRPFYDAAGRALAGPIARLTALKKSGKINSFSRGLFSGDTASPVKHGLDRAISPKGEAQNTGARVHKVFMQVFSSAKKAGKGIVDAFKPAMPFFQNILIPLLKGIGEGVIGGVIGAFKVLKPLLALLGWFGKTVGPGARKIFEDIGKVVGFVFGGAILKVLGLLGKLGGVFRLLRVPIRIVDGLFSSVGKVIGQVGKLFHSQAMTTGMTKFGELLKGISKKFNILLAPIKAIIAAAKLLGLLDDGKKKPYRDTTTTRNPAPSSVTPADRRRTQRQHKSRNDAVDRAFGSGPLGPLDAGSPRVRNAPAAVIHNHIHAKVQIDGKDSHRSTVKVERRTQDAKP